MRIISLISENVKRLTAISITPEGNVVQITGKNDQGKSSVLDCIWLALEYREAHKEVPEPIHQGADKAHIKLDLGELIVTRTFERKGDAGDYTTEIRVERQGGGVLPSPQKVIDELLGALAFDPLEFNGMDPAAQFDLLGHLFAPDIDFKAIKAANEADYARRTQLNGAAKQARAAAALIEVAEDLPEEAPDVSKLTLQLSGASDHNAEIDRRIAKRAEVMREADRLRDRGNELKEEAQELLGRATQLETEGDEMLAKSEFERKRVGAAPALPAKIDTAQLADAIALARDIEREIQRGAERNKHLDQAKQLETESGNLTAIMDAREGGKQRGIAAAKLPVPGLSFGDGVVLLDGVPFKQGAASKRLRTSVAIGMAMKPKLRAMLIQNGERLDEDGMKILAAMAEENDYQIWVERVDSSGKVGFVIEDGHLKGAAPAAAQPKATTPPPAGRPRKGAPAAPAAPPAATPEPSTGNLLGDSDL